MNTLENTYTERTARAIEGMGNNLLTEAGRKKYIFEVDCLTGDFKLSNMESDLQIVQPENDLNSEPLEKVCSIVRLFLRETISGLAIKEFLE